MTINGKISKVYLNYGIVPVGRNAKFSLPEGKESVKLEAVFDDFGKVHQLTYDPVNRRFFGVRGWYKSHRAKSGDTVSVEELTAGGRYRFRFIRRDETTRPARGDALKHVRQTVRKGRDVSTVGAPINYGCLMYAPVNEYGVILLFGMVFEELGMLVEEIKGGFPDATIRRFNGRGWVREYVEFEYESVNFKRHKHDANCCDIVVCWRHNWKECPIEVCELSKLLPLLPRSNRTENLFVPNGIGTRI